MSPPQQRGPYSSRRNRWPSLPAVLLPILHFAAVCRGGEWSYDDHHGNTGPSNWKNAFPSCGGSSQSPINIVHNKAVYDEQFPIIAFSGYDAVSPSDSYVLLNNGHTLQLNVKGNLSISDGGLPNEFQLVQFHVHWGGVNEVGSEHKVNDKSYPMEIHFVHLNKKHPNVSVALTDPEGLAVLGVFVEIGDTNHPTFEKLISQFDSVKYKGTNSTRIEPFRMADLLPRKTGDFVRYSGSLTTPGCYESVIWTVFKNPIKVSKPQLTAFRTLRHGGLNEPETPLENNFRPVQPIGNRVVRRTFAVECVATPRPPPKVNGAGNLRLISSKALTWIVIIAVSVSRLIS